MMNICDEISECEDANSCEIVTAKRILLDVLLDVAVGESGRSEHMKTSAVSLYS